MYAPSQNEDRKIVTPEFLQQQTPGYDRPWRGDLEAGEDSEKFSSLLYSKKKRKTLLKRIQVRFHIDSDALLLILYSTIFYFILLCL